MQKISEEKIPKLIELIQAKPELYKKSFKWSTADGKRRKDEMWEKIAAKLNMTGKDCKLAWRNIRDQFQRYSRKSNERGRQYKYSRNLKFLKNLYSPEGSEDEGTSAKHDVKRDIKQLQATSKYECDPIEISIDDKWTEEMLVENSIFRSIQTKKCGEIMVDVDEHKFILNCFLCGDVCLDLDEFMCHIKVQHEKFLNLERETEDECLTSEISNTIPTDDALLQLALENSNADDGAVDDGDDADEDKWDADKDTGGDDDGDDGYMPESPTDGIKSSDDDNDNESNEIDLDLSNKVFVMQLINLLKRHVVLWDSSNSFRKRKRAIISILNELIAHYPNTPLTYKTLSNALVRIRQAYRYDRRHIDLSKDESEYKPKHWFFSKLKFLENVSSEDGGAKALAENYNLALPLPNLTDEQHQQLFEIYESVPCLWDVQNVGFRFKNRRQEALEEMLEAIKTKLNLNFTYDDLQTKIDRIHYACTQQKQQKLQCEFIEEEFIPTCKYYEQIAFLSDYVGPFKCPFCEETFNAFDTYRIHKSKHDGSLPYDCPVCPRSFLTVSNCNVHVRRHTRNFEWECKYCQKRFATSTDMHVHARCHTGEKPYFCELCGQSYRTISLFNDHQKRRHVKSPNHICTICSKAFYANCLLQEHMKAHLNIRDKVCTVCGKAFTSSKLLRQHKQIHSDKKNYICRICGKDFAQYAGLSGHMKTHGTTIKGIFPEEHQATSD